MRRQPDRPSVPFREGRIAESDTVAGRTAQEAFLSRLCAKHCFGFANRQLARISGRKGRGKKGQGPELAHRSGHTVKAATEPDLLIRIRAGKYSIEKLLGMPNGLFAECEQEVGNSVFAGAD
jgi:hypothetical protein